MKHQTTFALLSAAALAATLLAAPAAQAFTYERNASGDSGTGLNYTDPDENLAPKADGSSRFDGNGPSTYQQGGFSMQFNHKMSRITGIIPGKQFIGPSPSFIP